MLSHPTRHLALVFLFAATIATSCGTDPSDGDDLADTTDSTTTTSSTTTTTTSPTTTATEPTTSTTTVKDAVLEVHTRFMTEVYAFDSRVDGYEPFLETARQVTTGALLQRIEEVTADDQANGLYLVGPGFDSNVVSVEINETQDRASVLDCSLDRSEVYDADNDPVVPAATAYKLRESVLTLIDGQWYIEDVYAGGENLCDPEDYR